MSIALLIYWIFIKVMVFVESAPKIGDVYYDPLIFDSPDSYPSEDGEPPILRDQRELLHSDARRQNEGYLYDANHCKYLNGRILCGYDKNKGYIEDEERIIDMGNGCFSRGDRIECGYGNKPSNQLLRIPVDKEESIDETSDENPEPTTRQIPTRTSFKTISTTMTPNREIQPLMLKNYLLKSAVNKVSIKPNKLRKKAKKEKTKGKKPTKPTTISIETEINTSATSTKTSKTNSNKLPSTIFKINPTQQSSKIYSKVTSPASKIDINPLQPAPKIEPEQFRAVPNNSFGHVNQTLLISKIGFDTIPLEAKFHINVTRPTPKVEIEPTSLKTESTSLETEPTPLETEPTSLETELHTDQTIVPKTETDLTSTLSVNELDSLSDSDSSEYLSDSNTNDNIVMLNKNSIETPAVRQYRRQSVELLSDEGREEETRTDPPMDISETTDNDAESETNPNSADTTATACFEKQDRVVCYNYKTEAYE